MTEHIPAITKYRDTNGWREGWDRHAEEWVPLAPPPRGAPARVRERYREAVARELAKGKAARWPVPPAPQQHKTSDYQRGYNNGYGAGYRAALRKHGIQEAT